MTKLKTFSGRPASQMPGELTGFIDLLNDRKATSYLEIGSRDGDTFHAVMSALPEGSVGVAVDYPGGPWGYAQSVQNLEAAAQDLRDKGYEILVIVGQSTAPETYEQVETMIETKLGGALFDAVMIDADHRYDAVRADYEIWGPLAQMVAFHDIAGHGVVQKTSKMPVEVPRLWAEIKGSRESVELIDPDSQMGIGVLL